MSPSPVIDVTEVAVRPEPGDNVAIVSRDLDPGTRLRIGFHRVEIRHPTHYSFFAEIEPKPGDDLVIRADLHELIQ